MLIPNRPKLDSRQSRLSRAGDFLQQGEEAAFALGADAPVYRHALVTFVEALPLEAIIEIAPGDVDGGRGDEVVLGSAKSK